MLYVQREGNREKKQPRDIDREIEIRWITRREREREREERGRKGGGVRVIYKIMSSLLMAYLLI